MKRPITPTFVIGLVVAAVVSVAHARGWLSFAELPLKDWTRRGATPAREIGNIWQYLLICVLSLGSVWVTLVTAGRHRVSWLLLAITGELLALVWVGSLYHLFFQPLPCIVAAILGYAGAISYLAWSARPRIPKPARERPTVRVPAAVKSLRDEEAKPRPADTFGGPPAVFETTVLVCDLADKYELADTAEPAAAASAVGKFDLCATELLLKAGAHLHKADGEGVVALFGFPRPLPDHAEKAVRAAFDLSRAFGNETQGSNGDSATAGGIHVGVSSGSIVGGRTEAKREMFVLGEAVELARRFCIANRFYGSRILIGPRTFEMASNTVVARPIDFLSGVTAQERHEIYEPLALAADAPAELLARRDSFWNGVVLYREKRWAEAYSEFQKARSGADEDDPPLNLYLRRLEPLALQFMDLGRE